MELINYSIFAWLVNVARVPPAPPTGDALLTELSDFLVQENGDKVLL